MLTFRHVFAIGKKRKSIDIRDDNYFAEAHGQVTVQYPKEQLPIPEVGRYQLHVEMDDCIGCDLCAKICPVDCIEIETIKATGAIGQTSDGTTKRLHVPKFDIDMAKCMYCGLCTVVCPTECITMTNEFDRSSTTLSEFTYKFSEMSPELAEEKRKELMEAKAAKATTKG